MKRSYNTDGPECPGCGYVWRPDDSHYFNESGFDLECHECGMNIVVSPNVHWSWSCKEIIPDPE